MKFRVLTIGRFDRDKARDGQGIMLDGQPLLLANCAIIEFESDADCREFALRAPFLTFGELKPEADRV